MELPSGMDYRRAAILTRDPGADVKKANTHVRFFVLAERTGLEPATPGVTGRYSNQLNYHSLISCRADFLVGAERVELPTYAL